MYNQIMMFFLIFGLGSWNIYSSELDKSFEKLTSNCHQTDFLKNLNEAKEGFDQVFSQLSNAKLNALKMEETESKKNMLWNYLRILFPYKMPKTDLTKFNYMECYMQFDKLMKEFTVTNNSKWKVCLRAFYKDNLPEFEKKLFKCTDQLVASPTILKK